MKCGGGPTENIQLDIAFTDHNMSQASLEAFGQVIQAINVVCDDPSARFWAFIYYVSSEHPSILTVELGEEWTEWCSMLFDKLKLPNVKVEPSPLAQAVRDLENRTEE
jgi:hypothetical protein